MTPKRLSPLRVVRSGLCVGCGSCAGQTAPDLAGMQMNEFGLLEPAGEDWIGKPSEAFARTCPFSPVAANEDQLAAELFPEATRFDTIGRMVSAYVGAVAEEGFRERGSSGGMVSWVLEELLRTAAVDRVVHVASVDPQADGRFFRYRVSTTVEQIREGAKSRYYPVELSEVLREIHRSPGSYAVVGVPCFIKAIQLLRREDPVFKERIRVTLGLFCGHMKSARFVESFALQMGLPIEQVAAVEFRVKDPSRPASTYTAELGLRDGTRHRRDWWNLVDGDWGSGFFQASACNYCDDVIAETADISFGDAWVEPYSSDGRGTNVVVVRSPLAQGLIERGIASGKLQLEPVDEAFIVATQAAGFRQRREGLAYRLTWRDPVVQLVKRVRPKRPTSRRRCLIYRTRAIISCWSHRIFRLTKKTQQGRIYTSFGRAATAFYHGFAYSRGKFGKALDRFLDAG